MFPKPPCWGNSKLSTCPLEPLSNSSVRRLNFLPLAVPDLAGLVQRKGVVLANILNSLRPAGGGGGEDRRLVKNSSSTTGETSTQFPGHLPQGSSTLIARNDPDELKLIKILVEAARGETTKRSHGKSPSRSLPLSASPPFSRPPQLASAKLQPARLHCRPGPDERRSLSPRFPIRPIGCPDRKFRSPASPSPGPRFDDKPRTFGAVGNRHSGKPDNG